MQWFGRYSLTALKQIHQYICSAQSRNTISRLRCAFSDSGKFMPILTLCTNWLHNLEIVRHQCAIWRSGSFCWEPRSSFEFPSCIKVRSIPTELLHLCRHRHILKPPTPGTSRKFAYCEQLPSPWSGYGHREISDLWSAAVQGITISESSQFSSVSELSAISRTCKSIVQTQNWLHNLEIGMQFPDSENAQRTLEIAQIPRMHGTYIQT